MKRWLFSLLTGTAILTGVGGAQAGEVVLLTDSQMGGITAGTAGKGAWHKRSGHLSKYNQSRPSSNAGSTTSTATNGGSNAGSTTSTATNGGVALLTSTGPNTAAAVFNGCPPCALTFTFGNGSIATAAVN